MFFLFVPYVFNMYEFQFDAFFIFG